MLSVSTQTSCIHSGWVFMWLLQNVMPSHTIHRVQQRSVAEESIIWMLRRLWASRTLPWTFWHWKAEKSPCTLEALQCLYQWDMWAKPTNVMHSHNVTLHVAPSKCNTFSHTSQSWIKISWWGRHCFDAEETLWFTFNLKTLHRTLWPWKAENTVCTLSSAVSIFAVKIDCKLISEVSVHTWSVTCEQNPQMSCIHTMWLFMSLLHSVIPSHTLHRVE